jgi:hypothetical protein
VYAASWKKHESPELIPPPASEPSASNGIQDVPEVGKRAFVPQVELAGVRCGFQHRRRIKGAVRAAMSELDVSTDVF